MTADRKPETAADSNRVADFHRIEDRGVMPRLHGRERAGQERCRIRRGAGRDDGVAKDS